MNIFEEYLHYKSEVENADKFINSTGDFIVFKIKNDLDVVNLHRGFSGYIIKARYPGIIVPINSLTEYNGEKGVFIKVNDYAYFRKVKVLWSSKESAVVISDESSKKELMEYDRVIINPSRLRDGSKVR